MVDYDRCRKYMEKLNIEAKRWLFPHFKNCVRIHRRRRNTLLFEKTINRLCEGKASARPAGMEWGEKDHYVAKRWLPRFEGLVAKILIHWLFSSFWWQMWSGTHKAWEWVSEAKHPHPLLGAETLLLSFVFLFRVVISLGYLWIQ